MSIKPAFSIRLRYDLANELRNPAPSWVALAVNEAGEPLGNPEPSGRLAIYEGAGQSPAEAIGYLILTLGLVEFPTVTVPVPAQLAAQPTSAESVTAA